MAIKFRFVLLLLPLWFAAFSAPTDVLSGRYDQSQTSANPREQVLNTQNVSGKEFGKLFSYYVDGVVYAQPLFVNGIVYVATMNDKVYAFHAGQGGAPIWMRDFVDEPGGVTPVPITDITNNNNLNLVGNVGIESTPVIDSAINALYVVVRTKESGKYVQRLHRLSLQDGKEQVHAATIEASVKGAAQDAREGEVHFDPKAGNQRPALALVNGQVLIAWASHEDLRPYHGWIMTYDAQTLKQTGVLCTTPDTADGGVWQSGRGPAIGPAGEAYFETGNGGWDGKRNFGNSVIKLKVSASGLSVEDYFTPHNYQDLNDRDADLGSSGPLLIPGTTTLLCGDKLGRFFLLSAADLGHLTPDDRGIQQTVRINGGRVLSGPAFWNGPTGPAIFIWCETDFAKAFHFDGHLLQQVPFVTGTIASHASPGGALTITSNQSQTGSGILWATTTNGGSADHGNAAGILHALNAETLQELWNSEQNAKRDRIGTLVKFVPPLVADGRVYAPNSDNSISVYGLLPAPATSNPGAP